LVKLRKFQSVLLATSGILLAGCPAAKAVDAAISGVVRDSGGVPQMNVLVQLMRVDSSVIQTVRTDDRGRYLIAGIVPGIYQLKAVETSFLPTLRENLHVGARGRTEANMTLSTLLEALQWLPAQKRTPSEPEDDWTWTLRSAAYRPLLRFVGEDGLETIESSESHTRQHHGRLLIESGAREFGEGGPSETLDYSGHNALGTTTLVRSRVSDSPQASTQLLAGYAHENGVGSGMSSVIAYQMNPAISGATGTGMRLMRLRTAETLRLAPDVTAEIGNQLEMLGVGSETSTFFSPFADVLWTHGAMTASYVLATTPHLASSDDLADERSLMPAVEMRDGVAAIEHGLHQELKLARESESGASSASIAVYQDRVSNPIVDGFGEAFAGEGTSRSALGNSYLFDAESGVTRTSGENYSARGVVLEVSHRGPASTRATLQIATGSALTSTKSEVSTPIFQAERTQTIAMMLAGASKSTGTRWRASYRWQPSDTVNAVDLFGTGMADAYLSVFLRQSLHLGHIVPGGIDAVVDVRNLLAQGYHPFLTTDGGTLFFAQVDRSVQGGLAFYF
jgi:hypothetical protein